MKLGDITKIITGKLDANAANANGRYPFFTCAEKALRIDTAAYDCECVLVAGNGDLNVKYYNGPFNAYQRTYIIESNSAADVCVPYLYHFLSYYVATLRAQSIGGVIKYIKLGNLKDARLPLPPLEKQKAVSSIFELIDKSKHECDKQLSNLNDLVKSQFVEMFGDATSIASKWNQIPFGECLAVFESGNSPSCSNAPREDDNPAVLKLSALSSGRFIAGENKAMLEGEDINPDKEVKRGDILIARKNTPELVGSCAIVRDEVKNLMFPDIVFRVHPRDNVSGEYLCELLSGPSFSGKLKSLAHGSAKSMSNISKTALERLPVPLPPLSLQQQFADFVARVDKLRFDEAVEGGEQLSRAA